jgi:A/G-specific adenine glycosylase
MLQQTQVKTVLPYWERWMCELPTIQSLANASTQKIHKLWEGLGYYTRVRNLQKAARQIVSEHGGRFPEDFDAMLMLPGIGRYTAGAICSIAFNQPKAILDGNILRVLTRIFGVRQNPREKHTNAHLWRLAHDLVHHASRITHHASRISRTRTRTKDEEEQTCSQFNQSLMELGALVCTPRQPKCAECPVARLCVAFKTGQTAKLPNLGRRPRATERRFAAFVARNNGRVFVRQRPAGVVNAHLWEFPNVELNGNQPPLKSAARRSLGFLPRNIRPLCTIKHTITRYRITLDAFETLASTTKKQGRWLTLPELQELPFPSAHKRILLHLRAKYSHRLVAADMWRLPRP